MKTAEMKIEVSGGRVIEAKVMPNGCCVLTVELATATAEDSTCNQQNGIFKRVPASELRLDDAFMKYKPKTKAEHTFKGLVETAIKNGLKDFWRPVYDPSFDDNSRICYEPGKKPAVDKIYNWWKENAEKYAPERGSRLGTKSEYIAFLAVLIKDLVGSGWKVSDAWRAVCYDSKKFVHYWNSEGTKHDFETTGSRDICGWYDLVNTQKVLAEDKENGGFWLATSRVANNYNIFWLAELVHFVDSSAGYCPGSSGWLVLEDCPE